MNHERILLEHGGGGQLTSDLITQKIIPYFGNAFLDVLEDSAFLKIGDKKICFTTDSFIVDPIFFPGGDIGKLAVCGTINDLAVCGGKPIALSVGFIIEEGLDMEILETIIKSMAATAKSAGVSIVTGDTKVVPRGAVDKIFINTSGIGIVDYTGTLSPRSILAGDVIIINGDIGEHGATILRQREDIGLESSLASDVAPLNKLVEKILLTSPNVHCMRDATRGGLGAILVELANQSSASFSICEQDIPISAEVMGMANIMGMNPIFFACEGRMALFCSADDAEKILTVMHADASGHNATIIGSVTAKGQGGRVIMQTTIGGTRELDLPIGELTPRIC